MLPSDKETLLLLYGKLKEEKIRDAQSSDQRHRNLSPAQKFLLSSVSSRDKLFESSRHKHFNIASPTNENGSNNLLISPESYYDNYRSEDRFSIENEENFDMNNKSKSALGVHSDKRYFSMPRIRVQQVQNKSSEKKKIPRYFKDAAELLISRISKQIRKYFYAIRDYSNGKNIIL